MKKELWVEPEDWEECPPEKDLERADLTRSGYLTEIRLPSEFASIHCESFEKWKTFGMNKNRCELTNNTYLIQISLSITTYIEFDCSCQIRRCHESDNLTFTFKRKTRVYLGFRSNIQKPQSELIIPSDLDSIANTIEYLSRSIETTSPDKSYPSLRTHPPRISLSSNEGLPSSIKNYDSKTDIELHVPRQLELVLIASPLAYYTQSKIVLESRPNLRIVIPEHDFEYAFTTETYQKEISDVLRQIFFLDCLTRNAGQYGLELSEAQLLRTIDLDINDIYHTSPEERLIRYLLSDFELISSDLPEWHFATFLEPRLVNVELFPHLLDRLSTIFLPDTRPISKKEIIELSQNETFRGDVELVHHEAVDHFVISGEKRARVQGWASEGIPLDVFKMNKKAFENKFELLNRNGPLKIQVVLNDGCMEEEFSNAAEVYRNREEKLPIEVHLHETITRHELADIFESNNDFLHFIGHCDDNGLKCSDGYLSVDAIGECRTQSFFLNACGSYFEGIGLIEKGCIVGAVTLRDILDNQASIVGKTFAELIINGFSFENALNIARRRILMNKDYSVVGDGTHRLSQGENSIPSIVEIEIDDMTDNYIVRSTMFSADKPGCCHQSVLVREDKYQLFGNQSIHSVNQNELIEYLGKVDIPIIFDNRYYWAMDIMEIIARTEFSSRLR